MKDRDKLVALCGATEVSEEAPLRVDLDGFSYAVFSANGQYFVMADACSHGPGSLAEGFLDGEEIECPFHGGRFNIATGQPTLPPCTEPVRTWKAHLVEGQICIDPAERPQNS